ncbi:MAG: hypothetical protein HON23_05410 [Rickettsiales bacterium]|nr:hypothetical protein [Rickettsiales bacterium]
MLKFTLELQKCIDYLEQIFSEIKSEWPTSNIDIKTTARFFEILKRQNIDYFPTSNNLKAIKSTTNTNPIQFNYCNLGEILIAKYRTLKKKTFHLDRVSSATQLESININSAIKIGVILDKESSAHTATFYNTGNNAAIIGTDLDLIFDDLVEIKSNLQNTFKIKW